MSHVGPSRICDKTPKKVIRARWHVWAKKEYPVALSCQVCGVTHNTARHCPNHDYALLDGCIFLCPICHAKENSRVRTARRGYRSLVDF